MLFFKQVTDIEKSRKVLIKGVALATLFDLNITLFILSLYLNEYWEHNHHNGLKINRRT